MVSVAVFTIRWMPTSPLAGVPGNPAFDSLGWLAIVISFTSSMTPLTFTSLVTSYFGIAGISEVFCAKAAGMATANSTVNSMCNTDLDRIGAPSRPDCVRHPVSYFVAFTLTLPQTGRCEVGHKPWLKGTHCEDFRHESEYGPSCSTGCG